MKFNAPADAPPSAVEGGHRAATLTKAGQFAPQGTAVRRGLYAFTQRREALHHVTAGPGRIGLIARTALVLMPFERKMIAWMLLPSVLRRVMRDRSSSVEMRLPEAGQQWAAGDLLVDTLLAVGVRGAVPFRW